MDNFNAKNAKNERNAKVFWLFSSHSLHLCAFASRFFDLLKLEIEAGGVGHARTLFSCKTRDTTYRQEYEGVIVNDEKLNFRSN
jgi:hypothetical protein